MTDLGTIPASDAVVTGQVIFPSAEYVESTTKPLPVSTLAPGESVIVRFSGQEVRDQGGRGYVYHFSVSTGQGDDAQPQNDERSFTSILQIRPCPLNVKPTLDSR